MATYQELYDLRRNQLLLDKTTSAIIVAAETVCISERSELIESVRYSMCPSLMANPHGQI